MIFMVKQTFPIERILFESNNEEEAIDFLDNLILLGDGWFEVWEEGYDVPIQAGGAQAFSPYQPTKWDVLTVISALEKVTETQKRAPATWNEGSRIAHSTHPPGIH